MRQAMKMRQSSLGKLETLFSQQIDEEKKYWRNVLQRVAAVVRSLACNGLALRGHTEKFCSTENSGNFIMAMKLIAEFDPFLAQHIDKYGNPRKGRTSYLSAFTYEQFINLMAEKDTTQIIEEIKSAKYYSVIVDSASIQICQFGWSPGRKISVFSFPNWPQSRRFIQRSNGYFKRERNRYSKLQGTVI